MHYFFVDAPKPLLFSLMLSLTQNLVVPSFREKFEFYISSHVQPNVIIDLPRIKIKNNNSTIHQAAGLTASHLWLWLRPWMEDQPPEHSLETVLTLGDLVNSTIRVIHFNFTTMECGIPKWTSFNRSHGDPSTEQTDWHTRLKILPSHTPIPTPRHVQTCSLCRPYIYWQEGGWPSIERPSCLVYQGKNSFSFLLLISFLTISGADPEFCQTSGV